MFKIHHISPLSILTISMSAIALAPGISFASDSTLPHSEDLLEPKRWHNEAPTEVSILIEKLGTLADQHPEVLAGVALSYDRQSINLYTSNTDLNIHAPEVAKLIAEYPHYVTLIPVQHSYTELKEIQNTYTTALMGQGLVYSSVDIVNNKINLGVKEGSTADTLLHSQSRDTATSTPITVKLTNEPEDSAGRYDDYQRYFMGGSIISSSKCTLGIPLIVDGKKAALTAGHCLGDNFATPKKKLVGSTLTTAYPGNANRFGDWKIIHKSTYAPKIFTGPANSSSTTHLPISGESKRRVGEEVCHSGATTGQICRYVVEDVDTYLIVDGIKSVHQTTMYHDSDRNGYSDCEGFQKGDSGGPIYSANPDKPGSVKVHGIVKGFYTNFLGRCRYSYTQLSGVKAWKPSIRVDY